MLLNCHSFPLTRGGGGYSLYFASILLSSIHIFLRFNYAIYLKLNYQFCLLLLMHIINIFSWIQLLSIAMLQNKTTFCPEKGRGDQQIPFSCLSCSSNRDPLSSSLCLVSYLDHLELLYPSL